MRPSRTVKTMQQSACSSVPAATGPASRASVPDQRARVTTSKAVVELERLGYVRRRAAPQDARVRLVGLTERGREAVAAARAARAEVVADLRERLGPRRVDAATRVLRDVLELHGATGAVRGRRVRPPG